MIYNRLDDNWHRMRTLMALARTRYEMTKDSDFRRRKIERGDSFPFDVRAYESMDSERCIVEIVVVWSVITTDSLLNLAIAESVREHDQAATAIERPTKYPIGSFDPKPKWELAKKAAILGIRTGLRDAAIEVFESCDHLAKIRNGIVHDKPFELIDHSDDGVELREYPWQWQGREFEARFESLPPVFQMCDQVKEFVVAAVPEMKDKCAEYRFVQLYDG